MEAAAWEGVRTMTATIFNIGGGRIGQFDNGTYSGAIPHSIGEYRFTSDDPRFRLYSDYMAAMEEMASFALNSIPDTGEYTAIFYHGRMLFVPKDAFDRLAHRKCRDFLQNSI